MLVLTGFVLLTLGLFSGIWLVLSALGLVAADAGVALWVLFPGLSLAGYLMAASAAEGSIAAAAKIAGALLVLLGLASATGLVLHAAAVVEARSVLALWYVLVFGLALGATAWASHAKRADVPGAQPAQSR